MTLWDMTVDVLVVGSGGAGMVAALVAHDRGARTLLIEKAPVFGGTTAMSGGALWIPNHPLMSAHNLNDSPEQALTYLHSLPGAGDGDMLRTYVTYAPRMVTYLLRGTYYRARVLTQYPDYYPEQPGGLPGGRSLEPEPYPLRALGADATRLHPPHPQEMVLGRVMLTAEEAHRAVTQRWHGLFTVATHLLRYIMQPKGPHGRDPRLTLGNALVARLYRSLRDRRVPLWLETRLEDIIVQGRKVEGAVVRHPDGVLRIQVRQGLILTAGGFARNRAWRQRFHRAPSDPDWSAVAMTDTGEVLHMAEAHGAALGLMEHLWWNPVTLLPGSEYAWLLVIEKGLPGAILVDRFGQRFVNESAPYLDVGQAMYTPDREGRPRIPAFLIMDARARNEYPLGPLAPGKLQPWWAVPEALRGTWLVRANTLGELARALGIDPAGLKATVERFNAYARTGHDPDFGRGRSAYDRYYADPNVKPNPALAELKQPPFYAVRVYPGDIGTQGGLLTTPWAQVRHRDDGILEGLYAAGNIAASPLGSIYPGAGGTLGPALTWAYLAALHATRASTSLTYNTKHQPAARGQSS
ncbi:MAG: FAD-dependent oxidoreductase [Chloroflexi bacterium]|nr:FAD-dependent oxidoreductase [Chloroflexota bacterium]